MVSHRNMEATVARERAVFHFVTSSSQATIVSPLKWNTLRLFNPLALELDIHSLAHHLCKM